MHCLKPFKGKAVGIIDHYRSTANRQFTLNKDFHAAVFLLFWACLPFFEVYIYNLIFILRCCYPIFFLIIRPFLDVLLFSLHFFVISAFFRCRNWSKKIHSNTRLWHHNARHQMGPFQFLQKKRKNIAVGLRSAFYTFVFFV